MTNKIIDLEDEFAKSLLGMAAETPAPPFARYDQDGDCIEVLWANEGHFAQRLDKWLTIYIGRETDKVVGVHVKGIKRFWGEILKSCPGIVIEVEDERIPLGRLFTAKMLTLPDRKLARIYKEVRDKSEEHPFSVPAPVSCG